MVINFVFDVLDVIFQIDSCQSFALNHLGGVKLFLLFLFALLGLTVSFVSDFSCELWRNDKSVSLFLKVFNLLRRLDKDLRLRVRFFLDDLTRIFLFDLLQLPLGSDRSVALGSRGMLLEQLVEDVLTDVDSLGVVDDVIIGWKQLFLEVRIILQQLEELVDVGEVQVQ